MKNNRNDPVMNSRIECFAANTRGRDYAVGDIHGYFSLLADSLRSIGFDETRDRLFAMGDMVDRGPESAQVLDWLKKPWFHAIRGNHEEMVRMAMTEGGEAAHFHRTHGGEWFDALSPNERERIVPVLQDLPLAIEVATANGPVGLIHADLPMDDWQPVRDGTLSPGDVAYCLWSPDRFRRQYAGIVKNIRAVVHGHIKVERVTVLGNAYFIDTKGGAAQGGCMTFLDLLSLKAIHGPEHV